MRIISSDIEQFDKIKAVFMPLKRDTLKEELFKYIGMSGKFEAVWIVELGPYEGQWAMTPDRNDPDWSGFEAVWIPLEDLELEFEP